MKIYEVNKKRYNYKEVDAEAIGEYLLKINDDIVPLRGGDIHEYFYTKKAAIKFLYSLARKEYGEAQQNLNRAKENLAKALNN